MPRFIVERTLAGASQLTRDELQEFGRRSQQSITGMEVPYHGVEIHAAGDKIYCVHIAENAAVIYRRAYQGGFPADVVTEMVNGERTSGQHGILHQLRDERGF